LAIKKLDKERELQRIAADEMLQISCNRRLCSQVPENAEDRELTEVDTVVLAEEGIECEKSN